MRVALICVLTLCAVCVSAGVPPELTGCKVLRLWEFSSDAEGWQPDHNVGPLRVSDGVLSFENTGPDPWIVNREIGAFSASDYGFFGMKMRATAAGRTEVFFATLERGGPASGMSVGGGTRAGSDFRFYEYDMSRAPLWGGQVNLLRIDAVNGGQEIGAKVEIDWIAIYQPTEPTLRIGRPYAGSDAAGAFVTLPVANVRGSRSDQPVKIAAGDSVQEIECPESHRTSTVTVRSRPKPGRMSVAVTMEGVVLARALIATPLSEPEKPTSSQAAGRLVKFRGSHGIAEAELFWSDGTVCGVLRPLATLAYLDRYNVQHYVELCPDVSEVAGQAVTLKATENLEGGSASFTWKLRPEGANEVAVTCEMTSTAQLKVLRFEGPRLLAGEGTSGVEKTHGLFPGLEYLEKNEPTGVARHVGPRFADRHIPDPYEITVPVMAIETEKGVVGVSWDPMQEWASGERLPCAQFESPNESEGAANHLMTLFAPSIPDYADESAEYATTPYVLQPGKSIKITQRFFARPGRRITDVIPDYYRAHGVPKPPPVSHGVDGTIDVCMRAYTESLYFPDQNAWKNHIGLRQTPTFHPAFAATVLGESIRRGDPELARKIKIEPGTQLSAYTGATPDWFTEAESRRIEGLVSLLGPEGSHPYHATQEMINKVAELVAASGSDQKALGDEGENNSGLTLRVLVPILDAAARTGRKRAIEAGLRGLAYLNSCTVPRGSQTWEVHAHSPDILASAHALEANLLGYEITGDTKYLDHARFWAYTGLPFIYGWTPPIAPAPVAVQHFDEGGEGKAVTWSKPEDFYQDTRCPINPGATIPVFGTTMYVIAWFGKPVQWCGIAWAIPIRSYIKYRPDPMLETLADAVFASCTQQQFDKGWAVGTYPDSWGLRENTANMAFIGPDRILDYAYALKGEKRPSLVSSRGFDMDGSRCVLNTHAVIEACDARHGSLSARLKYYAGQDVYAVVTSCAKPASVEIDGRALTHTSDLKTGGPAYYYDPAVGALHIKCRPAARIVQMAVVW